MSSMNFTGKQILSKNNNLSKIDQGPKNQGHQINSILGQRGLFKFFVCVSDSKRFIYHSQNYLDRNSSHVFFPSVTTFFEELDGHKVGAFCDIMWFLPWRYWIPCWEIWY